MNGVADSLRASLALVAEGGLVANVIWTGLLVLVLLVAHRVAKTAIHSRTWGTAEVRKRWMVMTRNTAILILLLGLVIIWAQQLQTLALSLVAISLALVISVKELLLCVGGEILRSSTRLFTVGSRIQVNGVRGDVIDLNLLTTTVMEVGPGQAAHQYTGRAVLLPNSLFLSHPVYNETFTRRYVLHQFSVAVRPEAWAVATRAMEEATGEVSGPYLKGARRHIEALGEREGLDTPSAGPEVSLGMTEPDRVRLIVRVAVPSREKNKMEQAILRRFFQLFEETGYLRAPLLP